MLSMCRGFHGPGSPSMGLFFFVISPIEEVLTQ